jgi:glutaconyl-CoA/methylmalonyl-CoA decarboxylase subunit gamma
MKQKITVNGKTFEVEVGDLKASPIEVTVNNTRYSVTLAAAAEETRVRVEKPAPVETRTRVDKPVAAPAAAVGTSAKDIRAPMPGKILSITVKPGDSVTSGQTLCFLEAMKMKNAIRTSQSGVVASIEVSEGQKVAFNDVLVRIA